MLSRRSFLMFSMSLVAVGPAHGIGMIGAPELWDTLQETIGVEEGEGPQAIILVVPGCDHAGKMWEASCGAVGSLRIRWVPVYEGISDHRALAAKCLELGTIESVREMLTTEIVTDDINPLALAAIDIQESLYQERLARLLWESTGKSPAMPTMIFRSSQRYSKVVRGSIGADRFAEVIAEAV